MIIPSAAPGLVVHQLLCGREIADPKSSPNPIFGFAASMVRWHTRWGNIIARCT